jgi:hypothetical protein
LQAAHNIRIALLAAWLGMAIYFSAVVAPGAFGVLRSFSLPNAGEIAGTIVTRTLSVVNISGVIASLILLVATLPARKFYGRASFVLQNILLGIVAVATATGEWIIARRMRELRAAMHGQIDQVPFNDPNRLAFSALHGYSVSVLSVAMIAALVVILLLVFTRTKMITSNATSDAVVR